MNMKRAAPEIYHNMRSSGVATIRAWVNEMFPHNMRTDHSCEMGQRYLELYNIATSLDFLISGKNSREIMTILGTSDQAEIGMRRIASFVFEKRTGDKAAAMSMLAVKPAGGATDVAPDWLVAEASIFSQSEYKRQERARATTRGGGEGTGGGGGGEGAGGKGKKGKSKSPGKKGDKGAGAGGAPARVPG